MENKILVIGHKNPDTDSICSAISYAELKKELGQTVEAVRLGDLNKETKFVLNYFKVDVPKLLKEIKSKGNEDIKSQKVILVDHNEFTQAVDGIENAVIEEVIDHHRVDFKTSGPLYYRCEPLGCTCTIVAKMYKENDIEPSEEIAGLMLSAIISDTVLFKSVTCTDEDRKMAEYLADLAGVDIQEYGKDMIAAGASIEGEDMYKLIKSDMKLFDMGDSKFTISQVMLSGLDKVLNDKKNIQKLMNQIRKEENANTSVLMLSDIVLAGTELLFVGEDEDMVRKAFDIPSDKDSIFLQNVLSRKKQIVPPLTEAVNKL